MHSINLPEYMLIGGPERYPVRRKPSKNYSQRYRLLSCPVREVRSVSLKTTDLSVARRRVVKYVEDRIREIVLATPKGQALHGSLPKIIDEYIRDLRANGNSEKHCEQKRGRLLRTIKAAAFSSYAEVDAVRTKAAIAAMNGKVKTTQTRNKYVEEMRSWTRWMYLNERWPHDPLARLGKIKGDSSNTRPRAILTADQFHTLLETTLKQPERRCLSGVQRYHLYLTACMTGARAQELRSLTPKSFRLDDKQPHVVISCTISKRRKRDEIRLEKGFAEVMRAYLAGDIDSSDPIWPGASWPDKAGEMLRFDLKAAGLPYKVETSDGVAVVDFHSFRAYRVTSVVKTGAPTAVIKQIARLSSESLIERYTKISDADIANCVQSIKMPIANFQNTDEE